MEGVFGKTDCKDWSVGSEGEMGNVKGGRWFDIRVLQWLSKAVGVLGGGVGWLESGPGVLKVE